MRIAVIGAGVVGLALARSIGLKHRGASVTIVDRFSIPSKGTSLRNSGVLHAGLYYAPNSLKARLCLQGRTLLMQYIEQKGLTYMDCGKLLVPHNEDDDQRLVNLKDNADRNGCETRYINYDEAEWIQPGIAKRGRYLWSPKTGVFVPKQILSSLLRDLEALGTNLVCAKVVYIDSENGCIITDDGKKKYYDFVFNVAGPGALDLYKKCTGLRNELYLLPILGEYAAVKTRVKINTNIYPVPDPALPFLGIHITPRYQQDTLVGPSAIPSLKDYVDEFSREDTAKLVQRMGLLFSMYIQNKDSLRTHANKELAVSITNKFKHHAGLLFEDGGKQIASIHMSTSTYGVRPQLINRERLEFCDDFICERHGKVLHVVNAVSPAFTSSFALAEYLLSCVYL